MTSVSTRRSSAHVGRRRKSVVLFVLAVVPVAPVVLRVVACTSPCVAAWGLAMRDNGAATKETPRAHEEAG